MEHRHIDVKVGQWKVAVVHSIWERGSDKDIIALIKKFRLNWETNYQKNRFEYHLGVIELFKDVPNLPRNKL